MNATDVIVGRSLEVEALTGWLHAAGEGNGRLVLCGGEPGIGKTRLGQELAGLALAGGKAVAWGRCVEDDGAPAFWPWRQVLRSLGTDPQLLTAGGLESSDARYRLFDDLTEALSSAAGKGGLAVILDDIHWADEPSLITLRHVADQVAGRPILLYCAFRPVEPGSVLPRFLPGLRRAPAVERLDLRGLGLEEVRQQLAAATGTDRAAEAATVLDVTGGNPLFVREIARAMADGTWRPDRPPRTVVEMVGTRLERISAGCRRLVQAAAVLGRDFDVPVLAATLGMPVDACLPLLDEAVVHGFVDRLGDGVSHRFVHNLTRESVVASLTGTQSADLHRAAAHAIESEHADDLGDHAAELARHWTALAPFGEAATARKWTVRAAEEAVARLAYEEGLRLYRAALAMRTPPEDPADRCHLLMALARTAHLAGDLKTSARAAEDAAGAARAAGDAHLLAESALVVEVSSDPAINAIAKSLCEEALGLGAGSDRDSLRSRLLAQRSHLAFYEGDEEATGSFSSSALELARRSGDDSGLINALHARKEACAGPLGKNERLALATEMIEAAHRTRSSRAAMWGELWRIDALMQSGALGAAAGELPALELAVERIGGPVSQWHLDRARAHLAQAQGDYASAALFARRGFERMRTVEPRPALGAYFALQCAVAGHIGVSDELSMFLERLFEPLPLFQIFARVSRAFLLLTADRTEDAAGSFEQAGPVAEWALPAFLVLPGLTLGAAVACGLGRHEDLEVLANRLAPFRGEHAVTEGVSYLGPVDLALGRAATVLGRFDSAVEDLSAAVAAADRAGARGFAAEARHHLAAALAARTEPGDDALALATARDACRRAESLGMSVYVARSRALVDRLSANQPGDALSRRESEVAGLVAEGLTNRQIAEKLVISERTAQNHVQHILTKLGFSARAQIAAWVAGAANE